MTGRMRNDELESIWEKVVMTYLMYYLAIFSARTGRKQQSHVNWLSRRDAKWVPPEHKPIGHLLLIITYQQMQ
jgi:hypothetical protein